MAHRAERLVSRTTIPLNSFIEEPCALRVQTVIPVSLFASFQTEESDRAVCAAQSSKSTDSASTVNDLVVDDLGSGGLMLRMLKPSDSRTLP